MLTEMAWQILNRQPQLGKRTHARHVERQACGFHVARQRFIGIGELEGVHHLRKPVDALFVERQRLPHFARRALAAIRDDVGGHRRPTLAVLLVDVLNDPLAPIAARQIEIDVGPLAAFLGQEALEQQLHLDRIDGRDPEAVADRAIGRRPAALHEDVLLPAVVDDVPDDQEVAGEIELLDEIELAGNLRAGLLVIGAVSVARTHVRHVAQERRRGFAGRHGIDRESISQIRHRVLEPLGQGLRACDRFGKIGEELRHHLGRLEISLGVSCQPSSRGIERGVMPHAGEHVEERSIGRRRATHIVGGDDRHAKPAGELDQRRVLTFLVTQEVALQLDAHVAATEQTHQSIEQAPDAVMAHIEQRPTRERDEPGGEALELLERKGAFALWRAQLHARHEAAEVFVAFC